MLDMACGAAAAGRIGTARLYQQKIPFGWALDADGNETDDPTKVAVILPAAGPKGFRARDRDGCLMRSLERRVDGH